MDIHGGWVVMESVDFRGGYFQVVFFVGGPWKSRAGMEDFSGGIATGVGE